MEPGSIMEHFGDLTDPREDNKRHKLIDIIMITICAVICGADKWEDIEAFGIAKEKWLRKFLELPHGIPTHDTFSRLFASLNPEEFNRCFFSWIEACRPSVEQLCHPQAYGAQSAEKRENLQTKHRWQKAACRLGQRLP